MNNIKKNINKGFSLVELIVVIAIMAVLTAVLAPSLLAYVERSRAQKDDSAMGEVVNAVMLALADQNVYDEVLVYTCSNNWSCYRDTKGPDNRDLAPDSENMVLLKNVKEDQASETTMADKVDVVLDGSGDHWMYNDLERQADEFAYVADGMMRGVTITFAPQKSSNKSTYVLANGAINALGSVNGNATTRTLDYINGSAPSGMTLETMASVSDPTNHYLYNRVRATVGDKIELSSQTYRNSTYTIFIRMGTTGGFQADAQDAIQVYGQWNGTNLSL